MLGKWGAFTPTTIMRSVQARAESSLLRSSIVYPWSISLGELGFSFGRVCPNVQIIENGKVITEADLVLENPDCIIVVEVKAKPKIKDVKTHERRLERMRGWHDRNGDRRRILGVMAGAVFGSQEREAALESGLYVIVQSGDTMKLEIPEDFAPREW